MIDWAELAPHAVRESWFAVFLLDLAVRSSVVLAVVLGLAACLRARRVVTRTVLWEGALAALFVLPTVSLLVPDFRIPCLPGGAAVGADGAHRIDVARTADANSTNDDSSPKAAGKILQGATRSHRAPERGTGDLATGRVASGGDTSRPIDEAAASGWLATSRFRLSRAWSHWLVAVYWLGFAVFAIRLVTSWIAVKRLRRDAGEVTSRAWRRALDRARERVGIRRPVDLVWSSKVDVPLVIGWRSPTIIVPRSLLGRAGRKHRSVILAHELAHVRRADYAWHLALRVLRVVYWFQPLLRRLERSMSFDREAICDDLSTAVLGEPGRYRRALVEIAARLTRRRSSLTLGLSMAARGSLSKRLRRIRSVAPARAASLAGSPARRWVGALIATVITTAIGAAVFVPRPKETPSEPMTEVLGRVLDADGRAIAGARVAVVDGMPMFTDRTLRVVTDAEGGFHCAIRSSGATLVVEAAGYAPSSRYLVASEIETRLDIALKRGRPLRFRIQSRGGAPIDGARVFVSAWRGLQPWGWSFRSDDRGVVEWPHAPKDPLVFGVVHKDWASSRGRPLSADSERVVVALDRPLRIEGRVVDASGAPVPEFRVAPGFRRSKRGSTVWPRRDAVTGRDGSFRIELREPAYETRVRVDATGFRSWTSDAWPESAWVSDGSSETAASLDVVLRRSETIRARVLLADGSPAGAADVRVTNGSRTGYLQNGRFSEEHDLFATESDANGWFSIQPRTEQFEVIVIHDGGAIGVRGGDLPRGGSLTLTPWGTLTGRVVGGDGPMAKTRVRVSAGGPTDSPLASGYVTETDDEGRFEFDRVLPGLASVRTEETPSRGRGRLRSLRALEEMVRVESGRETTVVLSAEGREIVGRLTVSGSVAVDWDHARVTLTSVAAMPRPAPDGKDRRAFGEWAQWFVKWRASPEGQAAWEARWSRQALVKADGTFRLQGVPEGHARLTAIAHEPDRLIPHIGIPGPGPELGRAQVEIDVEPDAADRLDVGEVRLEPGGS